MCALHVLKVCSLRPRSQAGPWCKAKRGRLPESAGSETQEVRSRARCMQHLLRLSCYSAARLHSGCTKSADATLRKWPTIAEDVQAGQFAEGGMKADKRGLVRTLKYATDVVDACAFVVLTNGSPASREDDHHRNKALRHQSQLRNEPRKYQGKYVSLVYFSCASVASFQHVNLISLCPAGALF